MLMQVMLALTFLKSYSDVGKAKVECVSGCSCKAKVLDGKNSRPTSELHTERMEVSVRGGCAERSGIAEQVVDKKR